MNSETLIRRLIRGSIQRAIQESIALKHPILTVATILSCVTPTALPGQSVEQTSQTVRVDGCQNLIVSLQIITQLLTCLIVQIIGDGYPTNTFIVVANAQVARFGASG